MARRLRADEKLLYRHIGERLKRRREEIPLTQKQLGELVGLLRTSIANIEAGNQRTPLHTLYNLCLALEIEPKEILPTAEESVSGPVAEKVLIGGYRAEVPHRSAEALRKYAKKYKIK
jgi:transcriptional regulator with XRE-family HTH domain